MLELNEERFIRLLAALVGHGPRLQNNPATGLIPEEQLAANVVLEALAPWIQAGIIESNVLHAPGHEKRPSLVLTLKGKTDEAVGLVGAHFDVVPANAEAEGWERDPFKLWVGPGGTLYARGVTDCLGHVALLTDLLAQLAEQRITPRRRVVVVLIANEEEAPLPEIGLDYVVSQGALDSLLGHPIYWLDSADFGPTVGTGGMAMWQLDAVGVPGHSGMPQNCVNALELGMAAALELQRWFQEAYPPHPEERIWGFLSPSSLKATVISVHNDKITKIPGHATLRGDIRLTPFYDIEQARQAAVDFIESLQARLRTADGIAGFPRSVTRSGEHGEIRLSFLGRTMEGIACDLRSRGLERLKNAIGKVRGVEEIKPFAMTGSLPLVRALQRRGHDVQITGFGRSTYYHAPNEQAKIEHFRDGFAILCELLLGD